MSTKLMHWLLDRVRRQALRDDDGFSDVELLRRFQQAHEHFGRLDVVVNNAGLNIPERRWAKP